MFHPFCPEFKQISFSDCQFFFLCIEGKARRNGCSLGDVFNPASLACERQDRVEGPCSRHYNQVQQYDY